MSGTEDVKPTVQQGAFVKGLGEMIGKLMQDHHASFAPLTQKLKESGVENFLEGMEDHNKQFLGPLIASLPEGMQWPDGIKELLAEIADPEHQFSGFLQQFLMFGVLFSIAGQMLQPFLTVLQQTQWEHLASSDSGVGLQMSPPDIATAITRGITFGESPVADIAAEWYSLASRAGVQPDTLRSLVNITGMPPAPQMLYEMFRRKIIDEVGLTKGLKQGDTRDEWIPDMLKLAYTLPSPIDFVRAAVQSELTYDEAKTWATTVGLDDKELIAPDTKSFDLLYNIAGRPIGPVESGRAALRGIIEWYGKGPKSVSHEQIISESDIKTKYTEVLKALAYYWPTAETVRTLYLHGGLTKEQAETFWAGEGITPDIAQALLFVSDTQLVEQDKQLVKGEISSLIRDGIIDDTTARTMLGKIGYRDSVADYIIELAHFSFEMGEFRIEVRKIASLYSARKINATQAQSAFVKLGLPDTAAETMVKTLEAERSVEVKILTPAQVTGAAKYGVASSAWAMEELQNLGYSAHDAWVLLGVAEKGPITDVPEPPLTAQGPYPGAV